MDPYQETYHIWEDDGMVGLARAEGWDAELVTEATIASIEYHVFDMDNDNEQTGTGNPTVADVIYDTPQSGNGWPHNNLWNLRYLFPASCFPTGGHTYRVRMRLTPAGSNPQPFSIVWKKVFAHDLLER